MSPKPFLPRQHRARAARGFTLLEVLVAIALVSMISLVLMGALAPWIGMKQKMDTERRLQDVKQGLAAIYDAEAMAIEQAAAQTFKEFTENAIDAGTGGCVLQEAGFSAHSDRFGEPSAALVRDGYGNPWCIRISPALSEVREGVTLAYRNVYLISTGLDGKLSADTVIDGGGQLTLGEDDMGITVSGREIQAAKLHETLRRMSRIAQTYETYFTTRYLANAARELTTDYFASAWDTGAPVTSTAGTWTAVGAALGSIGVAGVDALSAWETDNNIEVANHSESQNGVQVRSPASTGTGNLPFTALLRAKIPSAGGAYVLQVAVGNY